MRGSVGTKLVASLALVVVSPILGEIAAGRYLHSPFKITARYIPGPDSIPSFSKVQHTASWIRFGGWLPALYSLTCAAITLSEYVDENRSGLKRLWRLPRSQPAKPEDLAPSVPEDTPTFMMESSSEFYGQQPSPLRRWQFSLLNLFEVMTALAVVLASQASLGVEAAAYVGVAVMAILLARWGYADGVLVFVPLTSILAVVGRFAFSLLSTKLNSAVVIDLNLFLAASIASTTVCTIASIARWFMTKHRCFRRAIRLNFFWLFLCVVKCFFPPPNM